MCHLLVGATRHKCPHVDQARKFPACRKTKHLFPQLLRRQRRLAKANPFRAQSCLLPLSRSRATSCRWWPGTRACPRYQAPGSLSTATCDGNLWCPKTLAMRRCTGPMRFVFLCAKKLTMSVGNTHLANQKKIHPRLGANTWSKSSTHVAFLMSSLSGLSMSLCTALSAAARLLLHRL